MDVFAFPPFPRTINSWGLGRGEQAGEGDGEDETRVIQTWIHFLAMVTLGKPS